MLSSYSFAVTYKVNLDNMLKNNATLLEACATYLGFTVRENETEKKLYKNQRVLCDKMILKIETLFDIDCAMCKELTDEPLLKCRLCLQGSHNCEAMIEKAKALNQLIQDGTLPPGTSWQCFGCDKKNDTSLQQVLTSKPTSSAEAALHPIKEEGEAEVEKNEDDANDRESPSLNSGDEVDVIYLDYAKAFDKVDHNILLAKAKRYGITGKTLQWLAEFLKNRLQTVVVEGEKSSFQIVISGVPQGTVLGPILFILYIDDQLGTLLTALGKVFADDTKLISKIADLVARCLLQEDLFNVIQWALQNNMQLNETKFEVINYKLNKSLLLRELPFSNEDYSYRLTNGETIEPTQTVRDLGVLLSNDCSWTPHIHQMLKTAKKMASWVFSVFSDRSPFLMLTLFKTMVRSRLEYCCPVWNPRKITDIEAIENVQRNYTRRILGCQQLDYWDRLKKLDLLSLQRRRERYILIHTWKMANDLAPNDIKMVFKENARHGIKAIVPPLNNKSQRSVATHYENSFGVNAARLWNLLPRQVNSLTALGPFKVSLARFLEMFPDTPPTKGYTAITNNSLLEWNLQKDLNQE